MPWPQPGLDGVSSLQPVDAEAPTIHWTQLATLTSQALAGSMAEVCPRVTCAGTSRGKAQGLEAPGRASEAQGRARWGSWSR